MYEKIKGFHYSFWESRNIIKLFGILWIILFISSVISFTVKQKWSTSLTYPEEAYQTLENEATKMAHTHNLGTEYECTYTYNNVINSLSLTLKNVDRSNVSITATISDYNTDKQDINITRNIKNKLSFILSNSIAYFIIFPVLVSGLIWLAIVFILELILIIAFIFHKIGEKVFKSKE